MFSGTEPQLKQVQGLPVVNWLWYLSFATHTSQATYYTWTRYLNNAGHIPNGAQVEPGASSGFGYTVGNLSTSIGALIGIGLMFRVLSIMILVYRTQPRTFRKLKNVVATGTTS